ncbi:MAG: hypothetical protein K0R17_977 [Rariglobus sp.]|jgi:SAM-dependent methyltransferase|nr:hypothetical protein [Rariglobus sp.]
MITPATKVWIKNHVPGLRGALHLRSRLLRSRAIARYLAGSTRPSIHIGCGLNQLEGWLNSDLSPELSSILPLDVTRRFPFPNASFEYIFSEHMIEHVSFVDARRMLAECRRILRPGGIIRIATPDLAKVVGLYVTPAPADVISYLAWSRPRHAIPGPGADRCHVINSLFYGHGHRFIYDEETLAAVLREAGFHSVERRQPGESSRPAMCKLEHHGRVIGDANNRMETLVLEAAV